MNLWPDIEKPSTTQQRGEVPKLELFDAGEPNPAEPRGAQHPLLPITSIARRQLWAVFQIYFTFRQRHKS